MEFYDRERTAVFIDGAMLFRTSQALGFSIDYQKLRDFFQKSTDLIRVSLYNAVPPDSEIHDPKHRQLMWCRDHGYIVKTRRYGTLPDGRVVDDNMSVMMTVDILGAMKRLDHVVLFALDAALVPVVQIVQRPGIKVTVVASVNGSPKVSKALRDTADFFIELNEFSSICGKPPGAAP